MSNAVFPQVAQEAILNRILDKSGALGVVLTLHLYSNNRTPAVTDVAADYTEVSGGGYSEEILLKVNFDVTAATPSVALYNAFISWQFNGATDSPGTVYGAYITDENDVLVSAQRFDGSPYTPVNGSIIKYKPRITLANAA